MTRPSQFYLDTGDKITAETHAVEPAERNFVTVVSRQTKGDVHMAQSRRADITQQALSIMPTISDNVRRADYVAAGIIVTVLGGWLGGAVLASRVVKGLIYVSLIVLSAVLVGVALGTLLGFGFITVNPWQVLLFAIAAVAVLVLGVGLSMLAQWSNQEQTPTPRDNPPPPQQILIPVREVNPPVLVRVADSYPQVLVPVEEADSQVLGQVQLVDSRVLVPGEQVTPHILVPVEQVSSQKDFPAYDMYP